MKIITPQSLLISNNELLSLLTPSSIDKTLLHSLKSYLHPTTLSEEFIVPLLQSYSLDDLEILNCLNERPSNQVELGVLVDECFTRFDAVQINGILGIINPL